ncbi:RTC4-like domain-domain-containing protein [Microdochium bolleyi]|uniref:Restriction of telomere capping protein 4 n=1 Tax=Microdochium bolleyi TaxID=196109 RepID=A0A136JFS1_9PEZI|nr:RTC4-like domain-domain-containing protein [Microdochium bolleyi]
MSDLDVMAPPLASSDEEGMPSLTDNVTSVTNRPRREESISDGDDSDQRSRTADIQRSTWNTQSQTKSRGGASLAHRGEPSAKYARASRDQSAGRLMKERSNDAEATSSQEKAGSQPSSQYIDETYGWTRPSSQKSKATKGKIRRPPDGLARGAGNRSYSSKDRARDSKRTAKEQASLSSSDKNPPSPAKTGLKMPQMESSPEPTSPKPTLKRSAGVLESPDVSPKKEFLRGPSRVDMDTDKESPEPPRLRLPGLTSADDYSSFQVSASQEVESAPLPSLRFPLSQNGTDDELSSIGNADEDLGIFNEPTRTKSLVDDDDEPSEAEHTEGAAQCPMCHAAVDPALLKKHTGVDRMSIRQQTAFCRLHQRKEASSGTTYPKVDWAGIDRRLGSHRGFLKKILEGRQPSHYADTYQDKLKDKTQRTLFKSGDALTPGYYGPRGLRVMTEFVVRDLGDVLRKRAVEDMLVSSRGHTRYVQSVLVPELAVCLIMEDMSVSVRRARAVLEESKAVGELLNEDVGDFVLDAISGDDDDNDEEYEW